MLTKQHTRGKSFPGASVGGGIMARMPRFPRTTKARNFCEPRLLLAWEPRRRALLSSLLAVVTGPRPARREDPGSTSGWGYFRDVWGTAHLPTRAFLISMLWHLVVFNFPFPLWKSTQARTQLALPRIEVTWYVPTRDLPRLRPPKTVRTESSQPTRRTPEASREDAYHPRQRIVVSVPRPTHPRQTLIQPESAPAAPKILPPLPNLVQWSPEPQVPKPRLNVQAVAGNQLRQQPSSVAKARDQAPQLILAGNRMEGLSVPLAPTLIDKPKLAVAPVVAARARGAERAVEATAPPDLAPAMAGQPGGLQRIIALSAMPAEPKPVVEVPAGNLEANLSLSPDGSKSGVSSGRTGSTGADLGGTGAGGSGGSGTDGMEGPPGVQISGGASNEAEGASAAGKRSASPPETARPLPVRPALRLENFDPKRQPILPLPGNVAPGSAALNPLGPKKIYKLHVNMPNLTSATGSWVLEFAELYVRDSSLTGTDSAAPVAQGELAGPVAVRKVDPRYPPRLRKEGVAGEVVLYAIIRKDGSVDSIQLIRGVHPELDKNAMDALARWKFEPAQRNGQPVELEAVVRIPFRPIAPL